MTRKIGKRIEIGHFYRQYFITPNIGIKLTQEDDVLLCFTWLNRGISIAIIKRTI